jgi:hypothetical protein
MRSINVFVGQFQVVLDALEFLFQCFDFYV